MSVLTFKHGFVFLQAIEKLFCYCMIQKVAFLSQIMSLPGLWPSLWNLIAIVVNFIWALPCVSIWILFVANFLSFDCMSGFYFINHRHNLKAFFAVIQFCDMFHFVLCPFIWRHVSFCIISLLSGDMFHFVLCPFYLETSLDLYCVPFIWRLV